jgi:hypothetical protein
VDGCPARGCHGAPHAVVSCYPPRWLWLSLAVVSVGCVVLDIVGLGLRAAALACVSLIAPPYVAGAAPPILDAPVYRITRGGVVIAVISHAQ